MLPVHGGALQQPERCQARRAVPEFVRSRHVFYRRRDKLCVHVHKLSRRDIRAVSGSSQSVRQVSGWQVLRQRAWPNSQYQLQGVWHGIVLVARCDRLCLLSKKLPVRHNRRATGVLCACVCAKESAGVG